MLLVVLVSVFVGILLTLLVQWLFVKRWFHSLPILNTPWKEQFDKFYLPKDIQDSLKDPEQKKKKETCLCLNLFFQFLFQELRDTRRIRRWVMKRMNMEFTEMLQTTTGKLLDQITVRDFNLGGTFPIINNICIQNVILKEKTMMEELSLLLDLTYRGGFQLAVDVDMVFGKSAYLSVRVTKLQGRARLQFTRIPYTHWSFTFLEDPVMEFEVESHFEGRPVPQITSLIVNQIRRSIRKKHTLPNYKIRYKPFFIKPEPTPPPQEIYYQGNKLSMGHLQITVTECNRLVKVVGGAYMYCTLAIDTMPWLELMSSRRKLWVAHDIEILKTQGQNIGLSFKDDYILDRYEDMVIVDVVTPYSPAALANIKKNDVVVAVGGVKVTNTKQAAKLMKQATDKLMIRVERSSSLKGLRESNSSPDFKFEEDTISIKDTDMATEEPEPLPNNDVEDYINITLTASGNQANPQADKATAKDSNGSESLLEEGGLNSSPSKKGFSILSSSTGLFHRKKSKFERDRDKSPSKGGSPEPKVKGESQKSSEDEQKVKATGTTKPPSPDLQRKKCKENGTKDKTKENIPRFETISVADSFDPGTGTSSDDFAEQDSVDLKKTQFLRAAEDLLFNEKFEFDVEEAHNYLNVCVWCKIPEKLDKQNRVVKPEKDILLGHVSIPLMDIALECLATLQGDFQMTYKLTPAEMKAGASRTKISNLAAHPGFDEKLCYGDITLEFCHVHSSGPFSKMDRENITRIQQEAENPNPEHLKRADNSSKVQQTIKRSPPEAGKHDFIGTHFQSATYCNFCHKKIWLKTAFQCQVCGMVCHKKCTERCQAQTICTKDGFRIKEPPSTVFRKSVKEQGKEEGKDSSTKESLAGHRASFLSKFRKEGGRGADAAKAGSVDSTTKPGRRPSTPEPSIETSVEFSERTRRNSAPEEEHLLGTDALDRGQAGKDGLLGVNNVPRTRSSASIGDLVRSKLSPSLGRKKAPVSSGESSDTDDEVMNVLQFYEKQKAAHNADELVVTAAKEMGRELYAHLDAEQRKDKLDGMIGKLQQEIDQESENRSELCRLEREVSDAKQRMSIKAKIEKSDEKVQSLALLMLHYCAGLQHCLEEQEVERQRKELEESSAMLDDVETVPSAGGLVVKVKTGTDEEENGGYTNGQANEQASEEYALGGKLKCLDGDGDGDRSEEEFLEEFHDHPRSRPTGAAAMTSTPSDTQIPHQKKKDQVVMSFQDLLNKEESESDFEPDDFAESGKESDALSEDPPEFTSLENPSNQQETAPSERASPENMGNIEFPSESSVLDETTNVTSSSGEKNTENPHLGT